MTSPDRYRGYRARGLFFSAGVDTGKPGLRLLVLDQFEEVLNSDEAEESKLEFSSNLGDALKDGQTWACSRCVKSPSLRSMVTGIYCRQGSPLASVWTCSLIPKPPKRYARPPKLLASRLWMTQWNAFSGPEHSAGTHK